MGAFFVFDPLDGPEVGGYKVAMKRVVRTAALTVAALTAAGCLRIMPRDRTEPPAAAIHRHVLCSAVEVRGDWAEPGLDTTSFQIGRDEAAHSFLELRELRGCHALQWKWYGPARRLYRSSDPVAVGAEGQTFARYIAWDRLRLDSDCERGLWTVAVFVDGRLAGSRSLEVR
jgi:hypothetical protein